MEHRTHVVPKRLAAAILHDMTTLHGAELKDFDTSSEFQHTSNVSEWCIDLGGMWVGGSPREEVRLRGLSIEIPSHHVEATIVKMRKLVPRRLESSGDVWYGLPYWHFALILLPQQYHSLLAQLVEVAPRAKESSETFEQTRAQLNTVAIVTADGDVIRGIVPPRFS